MGGNNKYQSTIGQNHSRRLGGIITAGACVPIILQSRLQKVKALFHTPPPFSDPEVSATSLCEIFKK